MADSATHYTVLARRFRPQAFDQVVGQQHVAQALQNAIRSSRVAHAYLFTGARGVGKTSTARILAKALNCPASVDGVPCNECDICQGISAGNDVDVLEIDGASNRGIDDIRSLRANVTVKSMRTQFKIYIIDEVHMLTREAFNALLKTLEEPPPNVKFVFCTTEPNKVPDTILSRCQRFDFSSIEAGRIVDRLGEIAEAEGYNVETDALELVARRAGGSMRDSQSLFDQLLAFGDEHITAADVHRLLGTADDARLTRLFEAVVSRQPADALQELDAAVSEGVQIGEFVDQLLDYARDIMVLATGASNAGLVSVAESVRPTIAGHASRYGLQTTLAAMQILSDTRMRILRGTNARTVAELGLVRIATLADMGRIDQLIEQMSASNNETASVPSPPVAPAAPPQPSSETTPEAPPAALPAAPIDPQKKTAEPSDEPPEPVAEPQTSVDRVDLSPGNERQFLSQLISCINDMTQVSMKAVSDAAISGPNHLALTFPRSYHLHKQRCEKPEVLNRLQGLATEIAGRPVRISLHLSSEQGESRSQAAESTAAAQPASAGDDEFVQDAVEIFGARVVKVDQLGADR